MSFRERIILSEINDVSVQTSAIDSKIVVQSSAVSSVDSKVISVGVQVSTEHSVTNSKIDSLAAGANGESTTQSKVDSVGSQVSSVGTQVDSVGTQVGSVGTQVNAVDSKTSTIDSRIVVQSSAVSTVDSKTSSVGAQVSVVDSKLTIQSAAISTIQASVDALQNNTDTRILAPETFVRDEDNAQTIRIWGYSYSSTGEMQDPDNQQMYINIKKPDGSTDDVTRTLMTRSGVGRYYYDWTIQTNKDLGEYLINVDYEENSNTIYQARYCVIVDVDPDISSRISSVGTQVSSVGTQVSSVGTQASVIDSRIIVQSSAISTIDSNVSSLAVAQSTGFSTTQSMINSVGTVVSGNNLSATNSKIDSVGESVNSIGSDVVNMSTDVSTLYDFVDDTIESEILVIDSKIDVQSTAISSVHSVVDDNYNILSAESTAISIIDSKVDAGFSATYDVLNTLSTNESTAHSTTQSMIDSLATMSDNLHRGEFTAYVFTNSSANLADGGNDNTETSAYTTQQTSGEIVAGLVVKVNDSSSTYLTHDVEFDLGWSGQMDNNTGSSKWVVVSGDEFTMTGAVDIPGTTVTETTTKTTRWRSGQFRNATAMGYLPFCVMLWGKVNNSSDTLTLKGLYGTTVSVSYEVL